MSTEYITPRFLRLAVAVMAVGLVWLCVGTVFAQTDPADTTVTDTEVVSETVVDETIEESEPVGTDEGAFVFADSSSPAEEEVVEEAPATEEETPVEPTFMFAAEVPEPEIAEEETTTEEEVGLEETATTEESAQPVDAPTPELSTDKDDYAPGETVTIFGRFFGAIKSVYLTILGYSTFNGDSKHEAEVTTDEEGSFVYQYVLENIFRPDYDVVAKDEEGAILAETSFLDAAPASVSIEQCANGPFAGPHNICKDLGGSDGYVTGNVVASKAHYFEGDFLPYRAIVSAPNPGAQRITLGFDTAKRSDAKHAIDYLSSFDYTEGTGPADADNANQNDPCSDVIAGCNPSSPDTTKAIPIPTSLTSAYPGAGCGVSSSFTGPTKDGVLSAWVSAGTVTINHIDISDPDTGTTDCESKMQVDFTLSSSSAKVVFAWSGHIAANEDPGEGGYWGAGNAVPNGSPYHMRVAGDQYSGAVPPACGTSVKKNECQFNAGNQELQLAGGAILLPSTGTIIVDKVTLPAADPQSFDFTAGGTGYSNFSLTDQAAPNSQELEAGNYSISETVPSGWTQTSAVCVSSIGDTETIGNIELDPDETVTCTFTNTKKGHIIVDKVTNPSNDPQSFSFTAGGAGYNNFSLTDSAAPNNQEVVPGKYSVSETVPTGWVQTSAVCDSGETIEDIDVEPGETVTCTFTNTKNGSITIEKQTLPDGSAQSFTFTGDVSGSLSDGQQASQSVTPGQYSSTETVPAGWALTDITCNDGNSTGNTGTGVATFNVEAGENVTCVFTNTQNGRIEVEKQTAPGSHAGDFAFTGDINTTLQDDGVAGLDVVPGQYAVTETDPSPYFALTDITCDDGNSSGNTGTGEATFNVEPGETVRCVFTNTLQTGNIIVIKQTDPDGDTTNFDFTTNYGGGSFSLADDEQNNSGALNPGNYSVSEDAIAGWDLLSATCDNGDNPSSIDLGPNETVICTFTNQKDANIIIEKQTYPDGSPTVFDFDHSWGDGDADLADGQTDNSGDLDPGTYSVSENVPAGWDLTSATCDDGSDPSSIDLDAGETVTCTFVNTERAHIIVVKDVIGNPDPTDFTFQNDFGNGNPASFLLDEDNDPTLPNSRNFEVTPGTYSVSEDAMDHWQLESATCDNGDNPSSVEVDPGETVTCTFVNEELITITLVKNTVGGNGSFDFNMTGTGLPASDTLTTVGGTDSETYVDLDQDDSFSIDEVVPTGWALTSATCDNGDPVNNITPEPGEDVTCTFENRLPAAQIDVTPARAFNAVNDPHEVTATVQVHDGDGAWGPAPDGTEVTFTLENNNNGAAFVGGVDTCTTTAGSCSVSINTSNTGSVEIHAAAGPQVLGVTINVETDGVGENSGNGTKTYVNARIGIGDTETNEVDDEHIFTVTVEADTGSGWNPVSGVNPVVTFSPSDPGTITDNCNLTGTNGSGQCTVEINSAVAGIFTTHAAASFSVEGVPFNIATDGSGENSSDAVKTYVDASISLDPQSAYNEVGDDHVITVTVTKNDGTGSTPADGETVNFSITNGTATFVGDDFCVTNGSGQCSVTITDTGVGLNTIDATVDVLVGGLTLSRATDGDAGPDGSDGAEKTYVDARISVGESATNNVGDAHVFTIHVEENTGSGWVDAVGEDVTTSLLNNTAGATYVGDSFCTTGGSGTCTVTINSNTPGTVDIHAVSDVGVAGLTLHRETDGNAGNSSDATKTYVAAKIRVEKVTVGGDDSFEFDPSWTSNFFLSGGEGETSGWLPLTSGYSVSELTKTGWDLTDVTCDSGDDESNITLDTDGELVTCVFTNTKRAKLTIIKDADPDDLQDFAFNITDNDAFDEDFALDDDETVFDGDNTLDNEQVYEGATGLVAGDYDVTEALPNEFWTHEGVTCTNDADDSAFGGASPITLGVSLNLAAGDEVTCVFLNTKESPTRTQGFWQTHLAYTTDVFDNKLGGSLAIGSPLSKMITNIDELFGAFWSNIANKTTPKGKNGKRTALEKARMQLLQQLVAAELNCAAFGCGGSVQDMIDDAHEAYASGGVSDIIAAAGEMDAFNNSGDTLVVGNTGKADPKTIKETVDLQFWDNTGTMY